jgi:hypothetical protein
MAIFNIPDTTDPRVQNAITELGAEFTYNGIVSMIRAAVIEARR